MYLIIGRARIPRKRRSKIANDDLYTNELDRVERGKSRKVSKGAYTLITVFCSITAIYLPTYYGNVGVLILLCNVGKMTCFKGSEQI